MLIIVIVMLLWFDVAKPLSKWWTRLNLWIKWKRLHPLEPQIARKIKLLQSSGYLAKNTMPSTINQLSYTTLYSVFSSYISWYSMIAAPIKPHRRTLHLVSAELDAITLAQHQRSCLSKGSLKTANLSQPWLRLNRCHGQHCCRLCVSVWLSPASYDIRTKHL